MRRLLRLCAATRHHVYLLGLVNVPRCILPVSSEARNLFVAGEMMAEEMFWAGVYRRREHVYRHNLWPHCGE